MQEHDSILASIEGGTIVWRGRLQVIIVIDNRRKGDAQLPRTHVVTYHHCLGHYNTDSRVALPILVETLTKRAIV